MIHFVEKLHQIAKKETRLIVGLMSGTSLDGLDVALCKFSNTGLSTKIELVDFETIPYEEAFRSEIRKVFAKHTIELQQLCLLNPYIALVHANMVLSCLAKWNISSAEVDLLASHGQTVYHAPKSQHKLEGFPSATLQIGDGDFMATKTGIITLSDFRQKHIAAGGEGAPLAVYGDYFMFSDPNENRLLLNMGGIANFTFLPRNQKADEVFSTDTGPGNTLIDLIARHSYGVAYDQNGEIAAKGRVNEELLNLMKKHPFFTEPFPKTTGPEVFNLEFIRTAQRRSNTTSVIPDDLMATLTQFTADTIVDAMRSVMEHSEKYVVYSSGGGAHNQTIMAKIMEQVPECAFKNFNTLGVSGDAKEAVLFAALANETIAGQQVDFGFSKGVPSVSFGKISFPE